MLLCTTTVGRYLSRVVCNRVACSPVYIPLSSPWLIEKNSELGRPCWLVVLVILCVFPLTSKADGSNGHWEQRYTQVEI